MGLARFSVRLRSLDLSSGPTAARSSGADQAREGKHLQCKSWRWPIGTSHTPALEVLRRRLFSPTWQPQSTSSVGNTVASFSFAVGAPWEATYFMSSGQIYGISS